MVYTILHTTIGGAVIRLIGTWVALGVWALLVYTTPPLTGLTMTGPVRAVLYVASDAQDVDFAAKVLDVAPDGKVWNVVDGSAKPELMKPGEIYRIEVNLKSTAYRFAAGHRIRLHVANSNFPQYERNSSTGGNIFDEATYLRSSNAVHFGPRYPSALVLPVVPK